MLNKKIIKLLLIPLLCITTLYSLDDENNLNLQLPKKLKQKEGKQIPLKAISKDIVNDKVSKSKSGNMVIPKSMIDTSKYKKVKLIDVVLETLSNSDLLKSARENVIQYEIKVKNAMADYYPTLNFQYENGRTRSEPSGTNGVRFKYYNDESYKFVLKQNLYSGGGTGYNLDSVVKRLEVAKNQYKITLDEEIKKAIKAYFGVVFASRSVMVNERNIKKLNKILDIINTKYENGAASIADLTSIKANVANSITKLVKEQSNLIEAVRYYEYIVGTSFEKTLPFEKDFQIDTNSFEEVYKNALEKNRNLVNYYKTIEVEKFNQKTAMSEFKPKVDFQLAYEKTLQGEDVEEHEDDLSGTVTLSYNLYNGGKDKNKVLEKSSKIRDLRYKLEEEKKKLKWNLSKTYSSIQAVNESLKSTILEIKASRKMVSAYWDAFKLGEQDLNTLLQGQRQLNSAETELVKYEKSKITDLFNILELTGNLSSFFDVDPQNPKFIDFSKSKYKQTVIAKDGEKLILSEKEEKVKEEPKKELQKEKEIKEVLITKPSLDEDINAYLDKFLNFDDDSYMIEIKKFVNIYDAFDFIKKNNISKNSITFDTLNNLNIETRIAHNNFIKKEEAQKYLDSLKDKKLGKIYTIKKVKDIKKLYDKYVNGLKIKKQEPEVKIKTKVKVKVVEKVRQEIKEDEFVPNETFKEEFLNSSGNDFTINVSSFANINKLKEFVLENKIYENSFFFKYGNSGQLYKLVNGTFKNYQVAQNKLNSLSFDDKKVFPIVEKISFVKKQYEDNLLFNKKEKKQVEYEYIDISNKNKDNYPIKKSENILKEKKLEKQIITKEKVEEEKLAKQKEKVKNKISNFEEKFLKAPREYFTSNLAAFDTMADAKRFVKRNKIENNTILVISNSKKIMVMSGVFEKRKDALEYLSTLPKKLKVNKPFIQKIFRTQDSYRKNNLEENIEEKKEDINKEQERLEQERKVKEAKAKKEEELRLKKLEEEKLAKQKEEQERLEQERKIKEAKAKKEEELRLKKLEEEKLAKQKEEQERLEQERKAKEAKAKKEEELRLKKLEEEKLAKQKEEVENKISNFEEKFLKAPREYFTSNLAAFDTMADAKRFVKRNKIENNTILVISNSKKIMVMSGVFEKRKDALEYLSTLPKKLKVNKPFIQKIFRTQDSYRKNNLEENIEEKKEDINKEQERKAKEAKAKKEEELRLKKLEDEKLAKQKEEQKRLEQERKAKEAKAKKEEELRLKKLEEQKLAKQKEEQERLEQERKAKEAKAKKEEELRLKKLEEEKLAKQKEEQERLEQERLEQERKAKEAKAKKEEELRLKKLEAQKKAKEEAKKRAREEVQRLRKLEEKKRIAKELALQKAKLEAQRKAKAKKEEELRLKKQEEEKLAKQKEEQERLAKEKLEKEIKTKKEIKPVNNEIEEIDFGKNKKEVKKEKTPYSKRLKLFKKKFYEASKEKYTLKLITIESEKVKWYIYRFSLDPNYVVIENKGKKSTIYYGVFNTIKEAKKKTEYLHPLIYESKPPVKKIGAVR